MSQVDHEVIDSDEVGDTAAHNQAVAIDCTRLPQGPNHSKSTQLLRLSV